MPVKVNAIAVNASDEDKRDGRLRLEVIIQQPPDMMGDIVDFHTKFDLTYDGAPRFLDDELLMFREKFMDEELAEYKQAGEYDSHEMLAKQFDALVDLVYVAMGTAYLHGFDWDEAWRRVHAANMAKVRATHADQSARGSTLDVVKPEGWKPPSYEGLV